MTIDGEIDRITGDARVVAQSGKSREIPSLTETYSDETQTIQKRL
jgi:hypothetical protein